MLPRTELLLSFINYSCAVLLFRSRLDLLTPYLTPFLVVSLFAGIRRDWPFASLKSLSLCNWVLLLISLASVFYHAKLTLTYKWVKAC